MIDTILNSIIAFGLLLALGCAVKLVYNWQRRAPPLEADVETENKMPTCTYCGGTKWFEGPSGGMSTNILCANPHCRHWFNYTPPPLDLFDDLKRVEPTAEEKANLQSDKRITVEAERLTRYMIGRKAFAEGKVLGSLRTSYSFNGYAEAADNVDRMCGFIDAMSEQVRGAPREEITDIIALLGPRKRGDEDRR